MIRYYKSLESYIFIYTHPAIYFVLIYPFELIRYLVEMIKTSLIWYKIGFRVCIYHNPI